MSREGVIGDLIPGKSKLKAEFLFGLEMEGKDTKKGFFRA